jgi:PhnB protein
MARVSTYLNFQGQAAEAFATYGALFGTTPRNVTTYAEAPMPALAAGEEQLWMHGELEILAGHVLMATDMLESLGHRTRIGNTTTINLELDDAGEAERLFAELSRGSPELAPLGPVPWGSLWGTCLDRYGVRWTFNVA